MDEVETTEYEFWLVNAKSTLAGMVDTGVDRDDVPDLLRIIAVELADNLGCTVRT